MSFSKSFDKNTVHLDTHYSVHNFSASHGTAIMMTRRELCKVAKAN